MIENACSYGWPGEDDVFKAPEGKAPKVQVAPLRNAADLADWINKKPGPPMNLISKLAELAGYPPSSLPTPGNPGAQADLREILVIDSLNTIEGDKMDLFNRLMSLVSAGPKMIILILDSFPGRGPQVWDFSADIVIRLDRDYSSGYLIRTIEVEKARYQPHVWGKHQLKIYEPSTGKKGNPTEKEKSSTCAPILIVKREGFSSFRRSTTCFPYKNKSPSTSSDPVPTPINGLTEAWGWVAAVAVAEVSSAGEARIKATLAMFRYCPEWTAAKKKSTKRKSPGYDERALVVSLRDDEGMTRQTMASIPDHWNVGANHLAELETQGRLEITYYPPDLTAAGRILPPDAAEPQPPQSWSRKCPRHRSL